MTEKRPRTKSQKQETGEELRITNVLSSKYIQNFLEEKKERNESWQIKL